MRLADEGVMVKPGRSDTPDFDAVRRVAASVEIQSIRCSEFSAELLASDVDPAFPLHHEETQQVSTRRVSPETLDVRVRVDVRCTHGLGDSSTDVAALSATFDLRYAIRQDASLAEEDVGAFAMVNGVYNAWPYLREAFQAGSVRLGLSPLTLRLLNVAPKR